MGTLSLFIVITSITHIRIIHKPSRWPPHSNSAQRSPTSSRSLIQFSLLVLTLRPVLNSQQQSQMPAVSVLLEASDTHQICCASRSQCSSPSSQTRMHHSVSICFSLKSVALPVRQTTIIPKASSTSL